MAERPDYRWSTSERQFRDVRGRFVARTEVRGALDTYLDGVTAEIRTATELLVAGEMSIETWHGRLEVLIKEAHTASGALASGGWKQAKSAQWAQVGRRVKFQYKKLAEFARELENGLPLDGSVVARAEMYGISGTGTYEAILRTGDIEAGFDRERRILNSRQSCGRCVAHAAKGWQKSGVLPGIGEDCDCLSNCRCTFERMRSVPQSRKRKAMASRSLSPVSMFEGERCRRRSRIAAVRDGVDASPIRFLSRDPEDDTLTDPYSILSRINSLSPGRRPLGLDDIYTHFVEAANSRFIADRFMFLDRTTLKNIASVANGPGIAFMNSHRTGGLSVPSELPFGRAFAGRYEEASGEDDSSRTVLGIYMLRGIHPNGASGPSTDDLHKAIESGTLSDVSMGLFGGARVCDVCGLDLSAKDESGKFRCPHAPGTHRQMEPEHIESQVARGVKGGKASYTLVDATPQEVSAVFKGAVPGAGFRKALALSKSDPFSVTELSEARESYAGLLDRGDRTFSRTRKPWVYFGGDMDILKAFRFWQAAGEPEDLDFDSLAGDQPVFRLGQTATLAEDPEKVALRAQLEEIRGQHERERRAGFEADAAEFAAAEVRADRLDPAEKDGVMKVYLALAIADHDDPIKLADGTTWSRVKSFRKTCERARLRGRLGERIPTPILPSGATVLSGDMESPETPEQYARRVNAKLFRNDRARADGSN